jgi:hypothetical protein
MVLPTMNIDLSLTLGFDYTLVKFLVKTTLAMPELRIENLELSMKKHSAGRIFILNSAFLILNS